MPRRMLRHQQERFLAGRRVAVLVTIGPDGRAVPTPIWYVHRDGLFYFRTAREAAKTENVRRDPRVSICVQDERPPYRAVIVQGKAEVRDELGWLGDELPRRYLGYVGAAGYRLAARQQVEQGPEVTLVVRPERITTIDYSSDAPLAARAWLFLRRFLPPWL